ncbi:LacI family DNA-binding transcriptional regulator [Microbacterium sp. KSW2-29]|uniref:LacI family DNA-binding transcriptional regulator n=1 Tax=Microbacterium phycohabitans TaxID=3075993 RepID=A0ABU3SJI9_9MICO|nr:LacI family DNA-binding transcriptional regulator [Microbacterium sp. KSW2-29]MDU0344971.1 LacI family DNA-binding transcriptional regulator [Microbacterium sp. KSW2-29]
MGKRVTLADVARRAGLSPAAASMILNGRPDTRLSQDAHERVHAAAAELGYRPNMSARALRTDTSHTVGFVSDLVATTRFASGLIKGALGAAEAAGQVVLVAETGGEPEREAEAVSALLDRQVDGIIFASMRARETFVPRLPTGLRTVMLNATNELHRCSVLPDEETGGRRAIELLLAAGIRDGILLLGYDADAERDLFRSATVAARVRGISAAMADAGAAFLHEESIWLWEPAPGYEFTARLLAGGMRPRAIVCLNDRLAFGALQALGDAGLRVPEDVSLVSFDNDELAAYLRPGLTTIGLPHEDMGRRAVELLLAPGGPPEGQHLVEMPVVIRDSIRRP